MAGEMPLDIMLQVMRQRWADNEHEKAFAAARVTAPYVHGKAPVARFGGDLAEVPDDELGGGEEGGEEAAATHPG